MTTRRSDGDRKRENTRKDPRYSSQNRYFHRYRLVQRQNYEKLRGKSIRGGLTAPKHRFSGLFFDLLALPGQNPKKNQEFEQGVPGYGPQVIAWQWLSLAAFAIHTARGPSPEP